MPPKSVTVAAILVGVMGASANAEDCASKIDTTKKGFVADIVSCLKALQDENAALVKILDATSSSTMQFPKDAVVAFDLSDGCPDGWKAFEDASGRFIIGTGQGGGLEDRPFRSIAGSEAHTLTNEELPPREIRIGLPNTNSDRYDAGGKDYPVVTVSVGALSVGGAGRPISMLPPFISLRFCKKM